ncbi:hypothetical protein [Rufibacter roseus]|uniref:Uncharacterized protein n=1 Tax=Rufibacter roseus TaxID=1567108 RepID=A0ABW2DFJ2_9BACT|nr:hypothetical protein [Rufibacter roseus]
MRNRTVIKASSQEYQMQNNSSLRKKTVLPLRGERLEQVQDYFV